MNESTSAALSFISNKLYYGLPALFVSMVVLFLSKKPMLPGHGKAATGVIVGGTSVGCAVIFGGAIAVWFGMSPEDANISMAIGGGIGLSAFTIVKALVKYVDKMEDKDIVELAQEVKGAVKAVAGTPAKKVVRKRAGKVKE